MKSKKCQRRQKVRIKSRFRLYTSRSKCRSITLNPSRWVYFTNPRRNPLHRLVSCLLQDMQTRLQRQCSRAQVLARNTLYNRASSTKVNIKKSITTTKSRTTPSPRYPKPRTEVYKCKFLSPKYQISRVTRQDRKQRRYRIRKNWLAMTTRCPRATALTFH